jgi:hypothetical protein
MRGIAGKKVIGKTPAGEPEENKQRILKVL